MKGRRPTRIELSQSEKQGLEAVTRRHGSPQQLVLRARIVLLANEGRNNKQIGEALKVTVDTARLWRNRWSGFAGIPLADTECERAAGRCAAAWGAGHDYGRASLPDRGAGVRSAGPNPSVRSASGRAAKSPMRSSDVNIVDADITATCESAAKKGDLQPHRIRYWLTPAADADFDAKVTDVCEVYQQAADRYEQGERTVSTDELTGVQALERKHPGLPMAPGKVERREFEYIRHGTLSFILSRDVVTGRSGCSVCRSDPYRS